MQLGTFGLVASFKQQHAIQKIMILTTSSAKC